MIKICPRCHSTWAGGSRCEDCGAQLCDPFADDAQGLPEEVWRYIRLQYGARRGMLVRVVGILSGAGVAAATLRPALATPGPWRVALVVLAILSGIVVWRIVHVLAGRAVRVWVLRRGRLNKRRLARAALARLGKSRSRARREPIARGS